MCIKTTDKTAENQAGVKATAAGASMASRKPTTATWAGRPATAPGGNR